MWERIRLRAETAAALSSQMADTATPKHGTLEGNGEPPKQQPHSFGRPMLKIGGRWGPQRKRRISTLQRSQKRRPQTCSTHSKGCSTHRHGAPTSKGPSLRLNCLSITADGVTPHLPSWSTRRRPFSDLNAMPAISLHPQACRPPHWRKNLIDMRQDWLAPPESIG
ncbi:Hypothetical predicted protein [Pelobates cultripes]|uniref:Uncharacterized protein n=1 Tax=Pelobates cultripes TaxID=61616 RepID=A0AAD1WRJ5_PELCU|nr:Hypothetical predicted protein [Pelobates cultripes]